MLNLSKGGGLNLTKAAPTTTQFAVELSWDTKIDPDLSAFELNNTSGSPVLIGEEGVCFYGQTDTADGALKHSGDSRSAGTETILIDVAKVDGRANEVSFVVTIAGSTDPDSPNYGQTFALIQDANIRIFNAVTGDPIVGHTLDATQIDPNSNAVHFGSLVKNGAEWTFEAVGDGFVGMDLEKLIHIYNPNVGTRGHG